MNRTFRSLRRRLRRGACVWTLFFLTSCPKLAAAGDYAPVQTGVPTVGSAASSPSQVFGKELSLSRDSSLAGTPLLASSNPQQVLAWDGLGGVANGIDYTGTRGSYPIDGEIDALGNHREALAKDLLEDRAHLLFSVAETTYLVDLSSSSQARGYFPGPVGAYPVDGVQLSGGQKIGGSAEVSIEFAAGIGSGGYANLGRWATAQQIVADPAAAQLSDIDGLEVWGPEPTSTDPAADFSDANKYSLAYDALGPLLSNDLDEAVSIWNGGNLPGVGEPYLLHSLLANAVQQPPELGGLGPARGVLPGYEGVLTGDQLIDLDAVMVHDRVGDPNTFDLDLSGGGQHDKILFSIRQVVDLDDPDGYYATGGEVWVLDAAGNLEPLEHGGHLWDHDFARTALGYRIELSATASRAYALDINALEVIGGRVVPYSAIPEPTAAALLLAAGATGACGRRR